MTSAAPQKLLKPTGHQLRASDPSGSVWVSASAGSGKTHVLVDRVIRLLIAGAAPDSILCITYTKAAAAEMSARLFERLGAWTGLDDAQLAEVLENLGERGQDSAVRARARRLFTLALETPGGLKIQTIHAFCERLLHLFPVEAGMSPGFRVVEDRMAQEMQHRATQAVARAAQRGEDAALAQAYAAITQWLNAEQFQSLIKEFSASVQRLGAHAPDVATYLAILRHMLAIGQDESADAVASRLIAVDREAYTRHAAAMVPFGTFFSQHTAQELLTIAQKADPSEELIAFYLTEKFKPRKQLISGDAAKANPATKAFLEQEQQRVEEAFKLHNTMRIVEASAAAYALAKAIQQHVEAEKHRLGYYDFEDLIARTAALLNSQPARDWVRFKLDPGVNHILLDEAQDTSPAQWQIIRALADEFSSGEERQQPRTLFVVGDPKQSIFSFQGADAAGFEATRESLMKGSAVTKVELNTSFRTSQDVLCVVDKVFSPEKLRDMGIAVAGDVGHTANRKAAPGRVELWPLLLSDDDDEEDEKDGWKKPVDKPPETAAARKLAAKVAATLKLWLDPARPRQNLSGTGVVKPGDILLLFQTRSALFRMVLSELRKANVPVAGADKLKLHESLIVLDLLMLLQWILLPEDDHALAVILKSPLVPQPLDDDGLNSLRQGGAPGSFQWNLQGENAAWLSSLRRMKAAPHALLAHVLTRFRRAIVQRLGSEALEASDEVLNLALDYEQQHGTSLFGFLQWMGKAETELKREMEKSSGEVRLMTVHGAKGLEAPIVFLLDAAFVPSRNNSTPQVITTPEIQPGLALPLWKLSGTKSISDHLEALIAAEKQAKARERDRLLYVGMTRAADELYVAGVRPKKKAPPEGSWWTTLTARLGTPVGTEPLRLPATPDVAHITQHAPQHRGSTLVMPDWVAPAAPETLPQRPQAASRSTGTGANALDPTATRRGRAIHRLLQELAAVESAARGPTATRWARHLALSEGLAQNLASALGAADLAPFLGADSNGEVDISGELASGEAVVGRIDRLAIRPNGIWLLDYKTDRTPAKSISAGDAYAVQMARYAALLQQAYPGRKVTAALYWTSDKRLETLPESLLTAALQESEQSSS